MNRFLASKRLLVLVSSLVWVVWLVCACGSTGLVLSSASDGGADSSTSKPDAASNDAAIADAGTPNDAGDAADAVACDTPDAWAISAGGLRSQGCKTAADCVAVYIGDDACESDQTHGGHCPNYAIENDSYAEYQSRYQAINAACRAVCGSGSVNCPNIAIYCDMQGVSGPNCEVCPLSGCPDGGVGQ